VAGSGAECIGVGAAEDEATAGVGDGTDDTQATAGATPRSRCTKK
jgi:hypothetical protein